MLHKNVEESKISGGHFVFIKYEENVKPQKVPSCTFRKQAWRKLTGFLASQNTFVKPPMML